MTIVLLVMVLVLVGTNIYTGIKLGAVKKSPPSLEVGTQPKAILSERHKLERTFRDRRIKLQGHKDGQDHLGWNYICTCGTVAPAIDNDGYHGSGSEQGAVKAFVNHRNLYAAQVDSGENELDRIKKEFEQYKKECICHDLT